MTLQPKDLRPLVAIATKLNFYYTVVNILHKQKRMAFIGIARDWFSFSLILFGHFMWNNPKARKSQHRGWKLYCKCVFIIMAQKKQKKGSNKMPSDN